MLPSRVLAVRVTDLVLMSALLGGCTSNPKPTIPLGDGPYSFHDTRLQYALLTDDRRMLKSEFAMTTEPTLPERIVAGFVLPVTVTMETVSWPASSAFRAYLDSEGR